MRQRHTITATVFQHLMQLIRTGKIRPGDRLPTEKELVTTLGVSRTCVREAIKSLEALQIVTVRPKLGAIVLEPSAAALFNADLFAAAAYSERADSLLEFRRIVEVGLAALAAEKALPEDLVTIDRTIHDYEDCLKNKRPPFEADVSFHAAIAAASQNQLGKMVLEGISGPLSEQLRIAESLPHAAEDGLRDHLRIFGAIAERNPDKARSAMLAHLANAERYWRIANSGLASQDVLSTMPKTFPDLNT